MFKKQELKFCNYGKNVNFGKAVEALKEGKLVYREIWHKMECL